MRSERHPELVAAFLQHRTRLLRFLIAHGAGEAAEDLLHDIWLKIEMSVRGDVNDPLPYLYRIANNLMIDRERSRRRTARRDHEWADLAHGLHDVSDAPASDRVLIAGDVLMRVEAAIDGLGERPAAILRRFRIDGIPQKQIAAELGVSLSTVESDLRRGYATLFAIQRWLDDVGDKDVLL